MPPLLENPDEDAAQFDATDPWVEPPLHADYGYNVDIAPGAFVNFNSTFIDTCRITIGARTLVAPSVSFYSGTHPLSPAIRQGTKGPEMGKEIHVGEDCWIGGNAIILPGITVGNGAVVGAGSVVTKVWLWKEDRHRIVDFIGRCAIHGSCWESGEGHQENRDLRWRLQKSKRVFGFSHDFRDTELCEVLKFLDLL